MKGKHITIKLDTAVMPNVPSDLVEKANDLYRYLMGTHEVLGVQLATIYQYLDQFREFLAPYVSCSKGCSHCCNMDVQLSPLEAAFIQVKSGRIMQQGNTLTTGHREPCTFLDEDTGACTIYDARPLACRVFHALGDPENCRPGRKQMQYGHPPTYGNDIFANIMRWVRHHDVQNGWIPRDIRDFFPAQD
ncbi:YkgJ family cysteine cluster protein [Chromobacterium haemolyticum]|uniref:YkgJ family cysteine cluster protein n=1 Tax=Chromobacterium haemolyticum TaxID=394935 RepID=UPI002449F7DA|nr:YkgJ family cysteine cluster protein [Chromobacterium haemolyticum]MDH0342067.1 YkgJ family cysteine cluster protein [Chromobacterium haemolyticum]